MVLNDLCEKQMPKAAFNKQYTKREPNCIFFYSFLYFRQMRSIYLQRICIAKERLSGWIGYWKQLRGKVVDGQEPPFPARYHLRQRKAANATTTDGGDFSINANEGDELVVTMFYFFKTVKLGSESSLYDYASVKHPIIWSRLP